MQAEIEQTELQLTQNEQRGLIVFAASILSSSSCGSGSPVSWWPEIKANASGSQHQFSMNWLGSSTASHGTPLMPATPAVSIWVSMWCRPWPNSWNRVVTSSWVNSAGLPLTGRLKLQTR